MGGGEEIRGCDAETDAEEGGQLEREVVAEVAEGADFAFAVGDGRGDGLLGFGGDELAEVEGSGGSVLFHGEMWEG